MKGKVFVISAPSGTGKTTIEKKLKEDLKNIEPIVSFTTRKPRPGEKEGEDYHFVSKEKFEKMIKEGEFLEWAEVYGNYYGTPKKEVLKKLKQGKNVLLTIDTQGAMKIKNLIPDAILIGILPPSFKEQERRMRKRKGLSEEEIRKRLNAAKEERKILFKSYDFRLINKDLKSTVEKIKKIIYNFSHQSS